MKLKIVQWSSVMNPDGKDGGNRFPINFFLLKFLIINHRLPSFYTKFDNIDLSHYQTC